MRILFLADFYPPVLGGLELEVQALAHGLAERGHEVSVAALTLDAPSVNSEGGVTVHRIRGWNRLLTGVYERRERPYHPTVPDPGVTAALRRIIATERPQVVSAHSWIVYSFLPLKRWSGTRLVMRLHDYGLVCPKKTFVYRGGLCSGPAFGKCLGCAAEQYGRVGALGLTAGITTLAPLLRREVDLFIANSAAVADASYQATGRPRSGLAVVAPWLSDAAFDSADHPRPDFVPAGDFLLYVGALGLHKGLGVLLAAYAGLSTTVPLVLVGMPWKDTPTSLPDGVKIVHNVPHKEVLAAWPHCTVALVPSLTEAFGVSAAEAMAAGRPVVATAVGGLKDIVVDGETGLLVPPGDPDALRAAIARLLGDPSERERMGSAGRERASRYAASRTLPEMEALHEGLLPRRPLKPPKADAPDSTGCDTSRMRILFLSDLYPPVLGGVELQVQALAGHLAECGHDVSVATLTLDAPSVSSEGGVTVHRIRGWNRLLTGVYERRERPHHPSVPDPGVTAALRRIIATERPQVVSAHSWIVYSFLPLKRWSGTRLVMRLHDYGLRCPKKSFVYRGGLCSGPAFGKCLGCAAEQYGRVGALGLTAGITTLAPLLRREVDLFIANSAAVADASYQATGRPRSGLAVVAPWLSDAAFDSADHPRPDFVPAGDFLLYVGALGLHKGLGVLLAAYAGLSTTVPLVLVGVPLKDTPTSLPDGVKIVHNVPHKEVLAAWPHCTVALVPSTWPEPFGTAATEAMAAGRPVVATAVGGLKDIVVDGETGLLVPPGDPDALRAAIARLLGDPSERERMGSAGRERASRYAASRTLPEMEALYRGLVRWTAATERGKRSMSIPEPFADASGGGDGQRLP